MCIWEALQSIHKKWRPVAALGLESIFIFFAYASPQERDIWRKEEKVIFKWKGF